MSSSSVGKNVLIMTEARVAEADRKVTVTQITTHYNSGKQMTISEHRVNRLQQQKTNKSKYTNTLHSESIHTPSLFSHFIMLQSYAKIV